MQRGDCKKKKKKKKKSRTAPLNAIIIIIIIIVIIITIIMLLLLLLLSSSLSSSSLLLLLSSSSSSLLLLLSLLLSLLLLSLLLPEITLQLGSSAVIQEGFKGLVVRVVLGWRAEQVKVVHARDEPLQGTTVDGHVETVRRHEDVQLCAVVEHVVEQHVEGLTLRQWHDALPMDWAEAVEDVPYGFLLGEGDVEVVVDGVAGQQVGDGRAARFVDLLIGSNR